ncbi:hypothetical protein Pmani_030612 [Petrolisthes manimaculis]|uniref:P-type ATPase A domain-containing protein n=1 Tax=Petrolisthes manimaculis TaxID=1843537 RepID=A0AAE1NWS8_9EUCA|nr:hypothetical protein Pmani_030612 [Petrolisthes manimaculis]
MKILNTRRRQKVKDLEELKEELQLDEHAITLEELYERLQTDPVMLIVGTVLIIAVVLTGLFQYYQESRSSQVMESFKKLVPAQACVIRDGMKHMVDVSEVCMGDIVEVNIGNRVPVDLRIISAARFKVDNSSLTGESKPQSRYNEISTDNPIEARNLAFFSSNVV